MLRTQISLTEDERRTLDEEAARTGRSISALIRAAVDQVYGNGGSFQDDMTAIEESFGAWKDREFDGESYVEALRSGRRLEAVSDGPSDE